MKDLRQIHEKSMAKLHELLGTVVFLKYHNDSKQYPITCTIAIDKTKLIEDNNFVDLNKKEFRILKDSLMKHNYKIKDFSSVIYNREEYVILSYYENTSIGNTLILKGEKHG